MRAIIAGSTGMIGNLILDHCIRSEKITEIISIVRKSNQSIQHDKLLEVSIQNFNTYDHRNDIFENIDIAFFCIGAYTGQVNNDFFKEITVDYSVNFAKKLKENSPNVRLCLLSGAGADRTEKSKTAFARFKGMAENQIAELGLEFYTFRPAYIYPVTPRKEPNFMYRLMRVLYPVFKLMGNTVSIKSTELARAMYLVGLHGADKMVLENKDIINEQNKKWD